MEENGNFYFSSYTSLYCGLFLSRAKESGGYFIVVPYLTPNHYNFIHWLSSGYSFASGYYKYVLYLLMTKATSVYNFRLQTVQK